MFIQKEVLRKNTHIIGTKIKDHSGQIQAMGIIMEISISNRKKNKTIFIIPQFLNGIINLKIMMMPNSTTGRRETFKISREGIRNLKIRN